MEETQKMMLEIKKACAEMILNTAKEAAARVMLSDRKALIFEKDLQSTKQETLRLLLRFKQMCDHKTYEAEVSSLNQKRRIAELEAQLNETEGMILELRAELGQAYDKLEMVENNHVHLSCLTEKNDVTCSEIATEENKLITSRFLSSQFNDSTTHTRKDITEDENLLIDDRNLSSVILQSKEPELYRNGCTQRIRAFDRNLLNEKLPYRDQPMSMESDSFDSDHKHTVETCTLLSSNRNMDVMRNPTGSVKLCDNSTTAKGQPVKRCIMQRKKSHYRKSQRTLIRYRGQALKSLQPSLGIAHHKNNVFGNNENSGDILPQHKCGKKDLVEKFSALEEKLHCDNVQPMFVPRRSLRQRKARYQDDDIDPSSVPKFLSSFKMKSISHESMSGLNRFETDSNIGTTDETDTVLASRYVAADLEVDRDPRLVHNAEGKDAALVDEFEVGKHNGKAAKNVGIANELHIVSKSCDANTSAATNGAPSHVDKRRVVHTYRRKHKKETSTSLVECSFPVRHARAAKKVNINESRESRRLAQVARQLISLSGKRY